MLKKLLILTTYCFAKSRFPAIESSLPAFLISHYLVQSPFCWRLHSSHCEGMPLVYFECLLHLPNLSNVNIHQRYPTPVPFRRRGTITPGLAMGIEKCCTIDIWALCDIFNRRYDTVLLCRRSCEQIRTYCENLDNPLALHP